MSAEDRSGETLGSWRLLEILGVGAFATVYRGQHAHLPSKQAALKVLHSQGCRDEAAERREQALVILVGALDPHVQNGSSPHRKDHAPAEDFKWLLLTTWRD